MPGSKAGGGRLSPNPPARTPSPHGHHDPNSDIPRLSVSSSRSMKRSPADFEAALLDPQSTLFLKASPTLNQETMRSVMPDMNGDPDAPIPVEKRSYEDDLRDFGKTPEKTLDMISEGSVGVIPPTPSPRKGITKAIDRRISHATIASQDSEASTTSPSRMSVSSSKRGLSLGIDGKSNSCTPYPQGKELTVAELNESQKMGHGDKGTIKRKSMFRSPGTASSPDLATLVRKAKEAKAQTQPSLEQTSNGTVEPQPGVTTVSTRQAPPPLPHSQSVGLGMFKNGGGTTRTSMNKSPSSRNVSKVLGPSTSASEDGWDRFSDLKSLPSDSPEKLASISEKRSSRSRESSQESKVRIKWIKVQLIVQSLRNKAKGMFGRMFATKDHTVGFHPSSTKNRQQVLHLHLPVGSGHLITLSLLYR